MEGAPGAEVTTPGAQGAHGCQSREQAGESARHQAPGRRPPAGPRAAARVNEIARHLPASEWGLGSRGAGCWRSVTAQESLGARPLPIAQRKARSPRKGRLRGAGAGGEGGEGSAPKPVSQPRPHSAFTGCQGLGPAPHAARPPGPGGSAPGVGAPSVRCLHCEKACSGDEKAEAQRGAKKWTRAATGPPGLSWHHRASDQEEGEARCAVGADARPGTHAGTPQEAGHSERPGYMGLQLGDTAENLCPGPWPEGRRGEGPHAGHRPTRSVPVLPCPAPPGPSRRVGPLILSSRSAGRGCSTISPPTIKNHITKGAEPAAFHRDSRPAPRSLKTRPPHPANSRGSLGRCSSPRTQRPGLTDLSLALRGLSSPTQALGTPRTP